MGPQRVGHDWATFTSLHFSAPFSGEKTGTEKWSHMPRATQLKGKSQDSNPCSLTPEHTHLPILYLRVLPPRIGILILQFRPKKKKKEFRPRCLFDVTSPSETKAWPWTLVIHWNNKLGKSLGDKSTSPIGLWPHLHLNTHQLQVSGWLHFPLSAPLGLDDPWGTKGRSNLFFQSGREGKPVKPVLDHKGWPRSLPRRQGNGNTPQARGTAWRHNVAWRIQSMQTT